MKHPPLPSVVLVSAWLVIWLLPLAAQGQTQSGRDVAGMSLRDLMTVEVSTASKFLQSTKEAPASITVVSAEDIRRHGYRTLAEILKGVRGFYSTYDRNYTYVGTRGFARPGDYNTRILLLVDGHRLNDGVYDMAPMGTDFPFDVSLIDRVEVIRGPGSSLYGTSAIFAVINVITKTGANRKGVQTSLQTGSLDTLSASGSYGRLFGGGHEVLVAGSGYRSSGQQRIPFPEFDAPGSPAVAIDLDDDETSSLFGSLAAGRFSVRVGAVHRVKQVPTASFSTAFGDDRESTTDDRAFLSGVYDGPLGRGWMGTARVAYDYYGYQGAYPTDYGDGVVLSTDQSKAHSVTGELTARRRIGRTQLLTAGVEVRRHLQNQQTASDDGGQYLDVNVPGTNVGLYVQDEIRPVSWLLLNAGLRLDRFSDFGSRTTPRAGLVVLPRPETAIKLLYGRAFRAPNPYERYYFTAESAAGLMLEPEQMRSSELVWEESLSRNARMTVTAFSYDVDRILEQRATENEDIYYVNAGHTRGQGVEAEVEARFDSGLSARFSHTFARVRDRELGTPVSNSPRNLSSVSVQAPVSGFVVAVEGQYVGERLTLDGTPLEGYFAPSITLTSPASRRLGFSLSFFNAFDRNYSEPGAEEHVQPSIVQDGRTVLLRLHTRF